MKQFIVPYLRDQPIWWEDSCMTRNAFFVDANLYFFCNGGVFIYYFFSPRLVDFNIRYEYVDIKNTAW